MKKLYIVEESSLPQSIPKLRKLDDQFWKNYIWVYILTYYNELDIVEIEQLIKNENKKPIAHIEMKIKKHIVSWFEKNKQFCREKGDEDDGIILNDEASSQGEKAGFYDLKFQHSFWYGRYFPFECKNLGQAKSISRIASIKEYVYVEKKDRKIGKIKKIDGGIYRHFINKYAVNQNFGGMIGFVIEKTSDSITEEVITKIEEVYTSNSIGKLNVKVGEKGIIRKSIFDNENTFDSIHIRQNAATGQEEDFTLHHIIMDFVNV